LALILLLGLACQSQILQAAEASWSSGERQRSQIVARESFQSPDSASPIRWFHLSSRVVLDLLDELRGQIEKTPLDDLSAVLKYNRLQHFGSWISGQDASAPCRNTRALVLIRDSAKQDLEFKDARECAVAKGTWHDPYTGSDRSESTDVQIDHVVPLKNAYLLGAHRWKGPRRCHYANYLGNVYHLLAVDSSENMSKGDRSPDRYLPPNTAYHCAYASIWMRIKKVWGLRVTADEWSALDQILRDCPNSYNTMTQDDFDDQVAASKEIPEACQED
jgi:5-methylcytosine-specific restriction endonuclease McrA